MPIRVPGLYFLLTVSGLCALGYEVVWVRWLAAGWGHELPATLAVVSAYFGGLGLGAWFFDRHVSTSRAPGLWYGTLEMVAGSWAILTVAVIPLANRWAGAWLGPSPSVLSHWGLAFGLPFFLLLPTTAALGAAFSAMERLVTSVGGGQRVAGLYAANTLGAVVGVLLTTFALTPTLGLVWTLLLLGGLNILAGISALLMPRQLQTTAATSPPFSRQVSRQRRRWTLAACGLLGVGYEVAIVRTFSEVLESTVYTFAAVLAVYLLGTATGAALYSRIGRRSDDTSLLNALLVALSTSCLVGVVLMPFSVTLYRYCRESLGDTLGAVLTSEMVTTASVLFLPTFFMGALFSHLLQGLRTAEGGVGQGLGINTLAGALGPAAIGVGGVAIGGLQLALVTTSLAYLILVPRVTRRTVAALIFPALALTLLPSEILPRFDPASVKTQQEGVRVTATVTEVKNARGKPERHLAINRRYHMGGTAAARSERRQAHLPLLLHPEPHTVLFLGLGTGITFGAVAEHADVIGDGVELLPEVVSLLPYFAPTNHSIHEHARLHVHTADARRFVQSSTKKYDVIVADLFHPARDGAGSLFTLEHFSSLRHATAMGGLVCQWLPLYQLDDALLRIIIRTFLEVFPHTRAFVLDFDVDAPVLGLVATTSLSHYPAGWFRRRVTNERLRTALSSVGLRDDFSLFGCFVAGTDELQRFVDGSEINTDARPIVAFRAPHFSVRGYLDPDGRLWTLLDNLNADPNDLVNTADLSRALVSYLHARRAYLNGLVHDQEGRRDEALRAYVESAKLNPDFTLGYATCLTRAWSLSESQPQAARELLNRLIEAQPDRPVAKEYLQRLFGGE